MKAKSQKGKRKDYGTLVRVAECLYRNTKNDIYYFRGQVNGSEHMLSLRTTNREVARERLREKQLLLGKIDADADPRIITLERLCNLYRETWKRDLRSSTVADKERVLKRIKRDWPTGRWTPFKQIDEGDCRLWLARYRFGTTSRNGHLWELKRIFALAVSKGWLSKSPIPGSDDWKPEKRKPPKRPTPSVEEFQQIVASVREQRFNGHDADESADFLEAQGLLGLGQAEISDLTVGDIDFAREQISVCRRKTAERFTIPLYPQARALLEKRCKGKRRNKQLFSAFSVKNERGRCDGPKRALANACKRLGLPHYSQRSLRRMFIQWALENLPVTFGEVAAWQGHHDGGALIAKVYSYVRDERSREMGRRMQMGMKEGAA